MPMYSYPCHNCGEVAYDIHLHRSVGCYPKRKRTVSIADVNVGDRTWSRSGPGDSVLSAVKATKDGRVTYRVETERGVISGDGAVAVSLWVEQA